MDTIGVRSYNLTYYILFCKKQSTPGSHKWVGLPLLILLPRRDLCVITR